MADLKGSINESNQWTLEAGDEKTTVYKYKWNGTIKRLIVIKREQKSLDGTNTLKLTISDVFTKYSE